MIVAEVKQRRSENRLEATAQRLERAYKRTFLEALQDLRDEIDVQALAIAIGRNDYFAIEQVVGGAVEAFRRLTNNILNAFQEGGILAAEEATEGLKQIPVAFDVANPRALRAAEEQGAQLVVAVIEDARAMIRLEIGRQFVIGRAPVTTARLIRDRIGLTPYHLNVVHNFETALREAVAGDITFEELQRRYTLSPLRGPGGLVQARIDALVDRYTERLQKVRAENLARTETIRALENGRQEAWTQAQERGALPAAQLREWRVHFDERLCPICRPLHGDRRRLNEVFQPGGFMSPPAHPSCRCRTVLVFKRRGT